MIADSPSQERGVTQSPPTAGASSKRTPSGSEVMSSACSPASRWCWRSISTAFGALRSNSLSLRASGLTMLVSSFQVLRDHLGYVYACFLENGRASNTPDTNTPTLTVVDVKLTMSGRSPGKHEGG